MKSKWAFIVIGLLLVVGLGGKIFMDKQQEKKEAEKMSVMALKERYANIKFVEIERSRFDKKTGAFDVTIKMTNQNNESVNFTFPFWTKENEIGAILIVDKKVQVKGITTNKINVIYSNEEEGEV